MPDLHPLEQFGGSRATRVAPWMRQLAWYSDGLEVRPQLFTTRNKGKGQRWMWPLLATLATATAIKLHTVLESICTLFQTAADFHSPILDQHIAAH